MEKITLKLKENDLIISDNILVAESFFSRLIGLMFKKDMEEKSGLWIKSCNSIHTCFMRFPIDAFFLDKNNKIVKITKNLKPWRMTLPVFKARSVIEFKSGDIISNLAIGDEIEVLCSN